MTNSEPPPAEPSPTSSGPKSTIGRARFAMVVLYVRNLQRSIDFYRQVGVDVSDPLPTRPVAIYRENGALRLILGTDEMGQRFDSNWTRTEQRGYQQMVEFFVDDDAAVDAAWERLTAAGNRGVTPPGTFVGPYATMVEDPDGNVVLITSEPATKPPSA